MAEAFVETADLYPIRTVSAITGIKPITLRAWERRYGLIKPRRTESGHRVYSARDIDKINRAVLLVDKGHSISHVAQMLEASGQTDSAEGTEQTDAWKSYSERMLNCISAFREDELDELYNEALALYSSRVVNRQVVVPLLEKLGSRWKSGAGTIAEEHFFAFYLRNKLGARFHHHARRNLGPLLITACLPGESHETGLLLFSLAALDRGYRLVNLGPNMPLDELPLVARRAGAHGLVLSGRVDPAREVLEAALPKLVDSAAVAVFVGGQVSSRNHDAIERAGATVLGDDIDKALIRLETHYSVAQPGNK